ncbi:MAG: serine/threonine protein kinase [Anaerolineales bacterium]|nr:serine/threonine protein kinase [Anaerolineales bacterium]
MPLETGEVLRGRYRISRFISQGGMGNIYLAEDLRLEGRNCAVKEIRLDFSLPEETIRQTREQFLREATVLARLDHPNLPKVSDFFSHEKSDYLIMDFIPGKDLRSIMLEKKQQKEFLSEKEVLTWAGQLGDALSYLHKQDPPILHRDIKPSNLKLTDNGVLKLVDFGLVKVLVSDQTTITIVQGRGTASYTPLEQYGGDTGHTDVRSDVYGFGATLYNLLTNTPPTEARERFLNPGDLIPPSEINPEISPRTERAILWALQLHPNDRPQDIQTFQEVLLGQREIMTRPRVTLPAPRFMDVIANPTERSLVMISGGLILISLIATLLH